MTLLSPLPIISIAVALKLRVGAALVDSAAAHLDLSEGSPPVIMADVVAANPIAKWSSVWFSKTYHVSNTSCSTRTQVNLTYWVC